MNGAVGCGTAKGPSVFAIAWIPRTRHFDQLPAGFVNHPHKKQWLRMFKTGNAPPPATFGGIEDFRRYLKLKDYRGIVGLHEVTIRPPNADEISHVSSFRQIKRAGYTPLKVWFEEAWASSSIGMHSLGEAATLETITHGPGVDFFNKSLVLNFRVGRLLNFFHRCFTGHYLPYASMDLAYSFGHNGEYEIEIASTNVPNVTVYYGWSAIANYTMQHIAVDQVEDFATADTRKEPPACPDRFEIKGDRHSGPEVTVL